MKLFCLRWGSRNQSCVNVKAACYHYQCYSCYPEGSVNFNIFRRRSKKTTKLRKRNVKTLNGEESGDTEQHLFIRSDKIHRCQKSRFGDGYTIFFGKCRRSSCLNAAFSFFICCMYYRNIDDSIKLPKRLCCTPKVTVEGYFGGFIPWKSLCCDFMLTNFWLIIGFYIQQPSAHQPGKDWVDSSFDGDSFQDFRFVEVFWRTHFSFDFFPNLSRSPAKSKGTNLSRSSKKCRTYFVIIV